MTISRWFQRGVVFLPILLWASLPLKGQISYHDLLQPAGRQLAYLLGRLDGPKIQPAQANHDRERWPSGGPLDLPRERLEASGGNAPG